MQRGLKELLLCGMVVAAASAAAQRPLHRPSTEIRIVPPLADPAVVPGIGRCTSDGRCTVTDAGGTRPGSRLSLAP